MSERHLVARPRRSSLVLAHVLTLAIMLSVVGLLEGLPAARWASPYLVLLVGLGLLFNLWYWGWNAIVADEDGLTEIIRGRTRRRVAWDDILAAYYREGDYLWGMAGSMNTGVLLLTTLKTPPRLFQDDGELTLGRLHPLFFWERRAAEAEAADVLRHYLGDRFHGP